MRKSFNFHNMLPLFKNPGNLSCKLLDLGQSESSLISSQSSSHGSTQRIFGKIFLESATYKDLTEKVSE